MTNDEVPERWSQAPIGSLCDLKNGRAFKPTEWSSQGLPIVRIQNLNNPNAKFNCFEGSFEDRYLLTGGELLFAWSGTPGTSFGAHVWRGGKAVLNQHIFRVDFDTANLDKRFFRYAINQKLDELIGVAHGGVGLRHVTKGTFENTEISLPPLAEQKRIADKLEAVLGRVDACRARLDRIPDLLKRFRQSVLAAATSGQLTEDWREKNECLEDAAALLERMAIERRAVHAAQGGSRKYREADPVADEQLPEIPVTWRWTNFDHCSSEISVGHVGPMKDRYVDEGTAFLRCQNVRPLRFDPRGLVRIPPSFHSQLGKSKLCGGEILVVRSGANTGDCCVFPRTFGEANCSDLVITRPLSGLCSEYGALYVNSPTGQSLLDQKQAGVAQPHFNIGAMRVKAFPLAPLPEQTEIVRRVEALFALADRIEARLATAQRLVERLTPATLSKAFRGDLVPQDPNDEPASKLLERLASAPDEFCPKRGKPSTLKTSKR